MWWYKYVPQWVFAHAPSVVSALYVLVVVGACLLLCL